MSYRKLPTHELVYRKIREMILFGELAPGQAVTIQGLVSVLEVGMTPVREAIRRLTAEGALEFLGNRRICVPVLSVSQLEELTFARLAIEPHLAYLASQKILPEQIEKLSEIDKALNVAIANGDVRAYLEQNYRFHAGLYRISEAHILRSIVSTLWLRVGPSLRVVCGRFGTYNLPDKHQEALDALRIGDADAAANAIKEDLRQGLEQIKMSLGK
ncbi:GntR family transcriptional regulator [Pseudohalocynthiibacter aestuariivivens]|uniref:GntR family transcriptional regulator n=1 Tax=Pseudohalocynthiibacter aestuariivivens TaxID=1591409 RepID=A0ABV5JH22_9RHOB|nr:MULTISPECIES: GntR family transcriptional regulator [Pseudohalocynthiibacter]MBS9717819.1 GntR family transcriptional regulator [Pseudohalocynthiibacter aestuariivivens]